MSTTSAKMPSKKTAPAGKSDYAGPFVSAISSEFMASYLSWDTLPPPSFPEFAFVGRSNVGKSSLLNALVQRRSIARVSKTPGRTQSLNFFDVLLRLQGDPVVEARSYFVDLPGYGYAAIAHEKKRAWGPELGRYVCEREALRGVLLLIDSRREPQEEEEWFLRSVQPELLLPVITKRDQLSRNELLKRRAAIADLFGKAVDEVPMVSTLHGRNRGIDELRAIIFDRVHSKVE